MKTMTGILFAALAAVFAHSAAADGSADAAPLSLTLDGAWRFSWTPDAARRPDGFWLAGFDDSGWGEIDVPSCVEMRGYGSPVRPHDVRPVSMYRRGFSVPAEWKGRGATLRFDGMAGASRVWLDGSLLGESNGEAQSSRFDVTDLLADGGRHLLAVELSDTGGESCGGFRFTGIFRSVVLEASDAGGGTAAAQQPPAPRPAGLAEVRYEEFDPSEGIAVAAGKIRGDLVMMKRCNVAAVRVDAARAHPRFREMCDELGLVVVDSPSPASSDGDCPLWARPAVWRETDRADPSTGRRVRHLAEPSDFAPSAKAAGPRREGLVDPLGRATSALVEFAYEHRPLAVVRRDDGTFAVSNRLPSASTGRFAGSWALLEDGIEKAKGGFATPSLAPGETASVDAAALGDAIAAARPGSELFADFSFALAEDAPWGEKGFVVSREQVAVPSPPAAPATPPEATPTRLFAEDDGARLIVECARTTAIFDRRTGTLDALFMRGADIVFNPAPGIPGGPQLTCARAGADAGFRESGLARLSHHPGRIVVTNGSVFVTVDVPGERGCGFTHETEYAFSADGSIEMRNRVTPYGAVPGALPRLGLTWRLPPWLERLAYYGRGPGANDAEHCGGSFVGTWKSTVRGQFAESEPPRVVGLRSDIRWVEFVDRVGKGVRFSSSVPFSFRALHYGWEDLDLPAPLRPPPREETVLDIDAPCGGGCAPFDPSRPLEWTLTIAPASSGAWAAPGAGRGKGAGR